MIEWVVFGTNKRDAGQHLARISRYRDANALRICDTDAILVDVGAILDCDAASAMASHAIRDLRCQRTKALINLSKLNDVQGPHSFKCERSFRLEPLRGQSAFRAALNGN